MKKIPQMWNRATELGNDKLLKKTSKMQLIIMTLP